MTPRNWAAFYKARQERARRALAEGQHRPVPLVPTDDSDGQAQQDHDQSEDDRD